MLRAKSLFPAALLVVSSLSAAAPPPAEVQIAGAVQAAPKDRRDGAEVLGYSPEGKLVTLRKGTNDLVCLADNPSVENFEVDCYHKELEPFMARGRELAAQGVKGMDRHKMRWKEVDDGKLALPKQPRMLYVLTGKGFDAASGTVTESYLRWVVYVPYATPESTGLSTKSSNEPWLMYPGTAGAHIMISPPKK
ncbi:MAG: hypothetical protein JNK48_25270 [Bryobacterales bacterium]|nr:hypothetical protein [Bryobacterales bacterium]